MHRECVESRFPARVPLVPRVSGWRGAEEPPHCPCLTPNNSSGPQSAASAAQRISASALRSSQEHYARIHTRSLDSATRVPSREVAFATHQTREQTRPDTPLTDVDDQHQLICLHVLVMMLNYSGVKTRYTLTRSATMLQAAETHRGPSKPMLPMLKK